MSDLPFEHVTVLMGGPSAEREVSLSSGAAVAHGLQEAGYTVASVDVTGRELELPAETEAVFIALHGEFGEDGGVQAELAKRGIPFTGAAAEASRLAFDKVATKAVLREAGIPTPAYAVVGEGDDLPIPLPVVVKPARQGSSIGIVRVDRESDWASALATAARYDDQVVVEAYIDGRELTVGMLDGETLPIVEIEAPETWYDYSSKYTSGACRYLVPAELEPDVTERCHDLARRCYEKLGCRGFGRIDYRMDAAGALYVLELNTIPGFTETSLLPKAAAAAGIGFAELCDRIMRTASC